MFGCETSLVDIILNSLLADTRSSAAGQRADKLGGRREGHIKPVSRVPRHHCDKSHKGNYATFYHTHTYIHYPHTQSGLQKAGLRIRITLMRILIPLFT
jgi:hypothetical protein